MLTPDETRILASLRTRPTTSFERLCRACGTAPDLVERVLSQLEWFNYVVVYHGPDGLPTGVQLTEVGARAS